MDGFLTDACVPGKARIRATGVVEAGSVWEDCGAFIHFHAVGLEDADERGFFAGPGCVLLFDACALFAFDCRMDLGRPMFRVLAVARVQREVQLFIKRSQFVKSCLDVFLEVVGHGHDQQWAVGKDTSSTLEVLGREAPIAFSRELADLIEVVLYRFRQL